MSLAEGQRKGEGVLKGQARRGDSDCVMGRWQRAGHKPGTVETKLVWGSKKLLAK